MDAFTNQRFLDSSMQQLRSVGRIQGTTCCGLRYRDVIKRSKLGLDGVDWDDLLKPWLIGVYGSSAVKDDLESGAQQSLLKLPDGQSHVLINNGVASDDKGELCYVIDGDFYNDQRTDQANVIQRLDFLNRQSRHFFHWCIKGRLHDAMGPHPIAEA